MSSRPGIRSSDFSAVADDAAKDDENISFLHPLPIREQAEWVTRLRWLRLADRLSENQMVEPHARRFDAFYAEWLAFAATGDASGEHGSIWREIDATLGEPRAISAWDAYLVALGEYTRPRLELPTLEAHDRMLRRLTGNVFEVFPYLRDGQRESAAHFGMLNQAMNNLRDLSEDATHGLSFFPREVLVRFGVTRASLLDGSAIETDEYRAMMRFWLDEHVATIRNGAESFVVARDLHRSLVGMRQSCLARYARIEQVLRDCEMDYIAFAREYWRARPAAAQVVA